jgi:hypothetical protein
MMKHKFVALAFVAFLFAVGLVPSHGQQQPQGSAADQEKAEALKGALNNGLLTQQEYNAKVKALHLPAEEPYSGAPVATKTASIFDPTLRGLLFTTYTIPADWVFQGDMTQGTGCDVGDYPFFRATSPDGLTGVKLFPPTQFAWTSNPRSMPGPQSGCIPRVGKIDAADYMKYLIGRWNVELVRDLTNPEQIEQVRKQVTPFDPRNPAGWRIFYRDQAGSLVRTNINSIKEMEEIDVFVTCDDQSDVTRVRRYSCSVVVGTTWAPEGKLLSTIQMWHSIAKRTDNPVHQQAWIQRNGEQWAAITRRNIARDNAFYSNLNAQIISNGEGFRAQQDAKFAGHEAQLAVQQRGGDINSRQQQDRWNSRQTHTNDMVDSILNQQKRYDPNTGQTFKTDNGYNYNWVNHNSSKYYQTNDINDNPNGRGTGNWTVAPNVH